MIKVNVHVFDELGHGLRRICRLRGLARGDEDSDSSTQLPRSVVLQEWCVYAIKQYLLTATVEDDLRYLIGRLDEIATKGCKRKTMVLNLFQASNLNQDEEANFYKFTD